MVHGEVAPPKLAFGPQAQLEPARSEAKAGAVQVRRNLGRRGIAQCPESQWQ